MVWIQNEILAELYSSAGAAAGARHGQFEWWAFEMLLGEDSVRSVRLEK